MFYSPDGKPSPSVISLKGVDANANRDDAGRDAIEDVAPGSEFTIEVPEDLEDCFTRLDEIRTELGELTSKLYAVAQQGAGVNFGYSGPPTRVRQAIQRDMDALYDEEMSVQGRINELMYVLPPFDQDNDAAEDEKENGDPAQPGNFLDGQARDTASKTIGWPDQNRGK